MKKKSRVRRFSKIYYKKGAAAKRPFTLILIYSAVFVAVAVLSYLFSMGINSYLNRPHCTKIELLPEESAEEEGSAQAGNSIVEKTVTNVQENGTLNNETEQTSLENGVKAVEIDLKTLESRTAFEKFLKKAKDDGKNAVVVCLKGDDGKLIYDSNLKLAQEWKTIFAKKNTDFKEVAKKINETGLIPIARMSAFFDQTAPSVENENSYIFEKENSNDSKAKVNVFGGGSAGFKRGKWLDATKQTVQAYVVGLAVEIAKLGFKNILIDNAWFPLFKTTYELENFENGSCNEKARLQALSKFAEQLQANGVKAIFSYPGKALADHDLAASLFGNLNFLKKIKMHAPIFLDEADIKKCEHFLIEIPSNIVFAPELYSNSKNINNLLKKLSSYEIESSLVVRNN